MEGDRNHPCSSVGLFLQGKDVQMELGSGS